MRIVQNKSVQIFDQFTYAWKSVQSVMKCSIMYFNPHKSWKCVVTSSHDACSYYVCFFSSWNHTWACHL